MNNMKYNRAFSLLFTLLLLLSLSAAAFAESGNPIIIEPTIIVPVTPEPAADPVPITPVQQDGVIFQPDLGLPTPEPTAGVFRITKSPSGERKQEGTTTYFTAKADNASKVTWTVKDRNGAEVNAAQRSEYGIVEVVDDDPTEAQINVLRITKDIDGWSFTANFVSRNDGRTYSTNAAVLSVTAAPTVTPMPTPTPTVTPAPTPTPSPTPVPTPVPTPEPTFLITPMPTVAPTPAPTAQQASSSSGIQPILLIMLAAIVVAIVAVVAILAANGMLGGRRRR